MKKQFKLLNDEETFIVGDVTFKKIPTVRVSCCKAINAHQVDNPSNRIFVPPENEVDVNDQLQ